MRLGLHLVKGIGEQHEALLDAELARGPYRSLVDVVERTGLPEEVLERLIRSGAMDSLGRPRRELLWQLREVAGASRGRMDGRTVRALGRAAGKRGAAAGRPMDLRLPATDVPALPAITESERIGDAYAVLGLDARRQVVGLFRAALDRLGAVTNASLADRRPGRVRVGGLVVTRQHPMTAKGTVFLALEDETGMVNVTLWPNDLGAAPRRGPSPRAAARRWRAPARGVGRQPRRARDPAAARGGRRGRRARSSPAAFARWATPACAGSADPRGRGRPRRLAAGAGLLIRPARSAATVRSLEPAPAACPPRFGFERYRNRRYQAAADAKNAPISGDDQRTRRAPRHARRVLRRRRSARSPMNPLRTRNE